MKAKMQCPDCAGGEIEPSGDGAFLCIQCGLVFGDDPARPAVIPVIEEAPQAKTEKRSATMQHVTEALDKLPKTHDVMAREPTAEQARSIAFQPRQTFAPKTLAEAMAFAKMLAESSLVPKDYLGKPNNILVAIQMGMEVGLAPMQAIQNIAVINGRPSLWGDAMLAVIQVYPAYEWHHEWFEGSTEADFRAVCEFKRRGDPRPHRATFSVADARKAGLWAKDGPWHSYPKRMLQMRARGIAARNTFADALRGLMIAEEALDMPEMGQNQAPAMPSADVDVFATGGEKPAPEIRDEGSTERQNEWYPPPRDVVDRKPPAPLPGRRSDARAAQPSINTDAHAETPPASQPTTQSPEPAPDYPEPTEEPTAATPQKVATREWRTFVAKSRALGNVTADNDATKAIEMFGGALPEIEQDYAPGKTSMEKLYRMFMQISYAQYQEVLIPALMRLQEKKKAAKNG